MKSKYLLQLSIIVVIAVTAMTFLQQARTKKKRSPAKTCCHQNCKECKQKNDNSDDIFFNPLSHMIVAVYK